MPDRVEFLTGVVGEGWWADITLGRVRRALGGRRRYAGPALAWR